MSWTISMCGFVLLEVKPMAKMVLAMLFCGFAGIASAYEQSTVDGITWFYMENSDGTITLGRDGANYEYHAIDITRSGDLQIPAIIDEKVVAGIGNGAFSGCSELTSVAIPASVLRIGQGAFTGCTKLTSVSMSSGVTDVDDWAFNDCKNLTSVTIPPSVLRIGECAFAGCAKLSSVCIPSSVTNVEGSAFRSCEDLSLVSIASTTVVLEQDAFYECGKIRSVRVPIGSLRLSDMFPYQYAEIESVTLFGGLNRLGKTFFKGCGSITDITFSNTVKSVESGAFADCCGLIRCSVEASGVWLDIAFDDASANPLSRGAELYVGGKLLETLVVQEGVEAISDYAFYNCQSLSNVIMASSVREVAETAFEECRSDLSFSVLKNGRMWKYKGIDSHHVSIVGAEPCKGCLLVPGELSGWEVCSVEEGAFSGCQDVCGVIVPPDADIELGYRAFANCQNLEVVELEGVRCSSIVGAKVALYKGSNGSSEWMKSYADMMDYFNELEPDEVRICHDLNDIGTDEQVAYDSVIVSELDIANGTRYTFSLHGGPYRESYPNILGNPAVLYIDDVKVVEWNSNPKSVQWYTTGGGKTVAYSWEPPSGSVDLSKGKHLLKIVSHSNRYIALSSPELKLDEILTLTNEASLSDAFRDCPRIVDVSLPSWAFEGTDGCGVKDMFPSAYGTINNLRFSEGLTTITVDALKGCTSVESLTIPSSVKSVETGAFLDCDSLKTVVVAKGDVDRVEMLLRSAGCLTDDFDIVEKEDVEPPSTYFVTYLPGEYGVGSAAVDEKENDVELKLRDALFVREGFVQSGWSLSDGGSLAYGLGATYANNVSMALYPYWEAVRFVTVRFNAAGGEVEPAMRDYVAGSPFGGLPVPTRVHYDFAGWFTEASSGMRITAASEVPQNDCDLFAHWMPKNKVVKFHPNGGKGEMSELLISYEQADLPECIFERKGFHFLGWATDENGGVVYADGASANDLVDVAGEWADLYAVWGKNIYNVRYENLCGATHTNPTSYQEGSSVEFTPPSVRTGYRFTGWSPSAILPEMSGPQTVVANWSANSYQIVYLPNGGSGSMPAADCVYDQEVVIAINGYSRSGYFFKGWAMTANGDVIYRPGEKVSNLTAEDGGIVNLYAVWGKSGPQEVIWPNWEKTEPDCLLGVNDSTLRIDTTVEEGGRLSLYLEGSGTLTFLARGSDDGFYYCERGGRGNYIRNSESFAEYTYEVKGDGPHTILWITYAKGYLGTDAWGEIKDVFWRGKPLQYGGPDPVSVSPTVVDDEYAVVTGDAETGFVVRPSEGKMSVEVTLPDGIDAGRVTVEVSTKVERVKPNGAKVKVVVGEYDITDYLVIPESDGVMNIAAATVKEEIVKETLDPSKDAVIELNAANPKLITAPTRKGLTYTLYEGRKLESLWKGDSKLGDGDPWTPTITVLGGDAAFYSIGVGK